LQCAKNSVGLGRQSHGCLNICRMSFRVTYNGFGLAGRAGIWKTAADNRSLVKIYCWW